MLMLLLLVAGQEPPETEIDQFVLLGQALADFGEKPLPEEYSPEDSQIWRVHNMALDFGATDIFFPLGAYDRRFYLQPVGSENWLVYMTKAGKADESIRFRWKIRLSRDIADEMPLDLGTLEMMLYKRGLRVGEPVPNEAWPSLKARKGFAAYSLWPAPSWASFHYWYVRPDGTSTTGTSAHDELLLSADPHTPFPYPVTAEEKAALIAQGWKYRPSEGSSR